MGQGGFTVMVASQFEEFAFYGVEDGGECFEGCLLGRVRCAEVDGVFCSHCGCGDCRLRRM